MSEERLLGRNSYQRLRHWLRHRAGLTRLRLTRRRPRVYVSADAPLAHEGQELLSRLRATGSYVFWVPRWRGYLRIEREIAACDAFLAIPDAAWLTSTWRASELTWANGDGGSGLGMAGRIEPRETFVYAPAGLDRPPWFGATVDLDARPDVAATEIAAQWRNGPTRSRKPHR